MSDAQRPDDSAPVIVDPKDDGFNTHPTRPWARWVAKSIDSLIVILVVFVIFTAVGIFIGLFHPDPDAALAVFDAATVEDAVFTAFLSLATTAGLFILFDAISIALFRSTPGKALLGIRIGHADGRRLGFGQSLLRSTGMVILGLGLLIPFVPLITFIWGYVRLKGAGKTYWDGWAKADVVTRPVARWRWVIGLILLVIDRVISMGATLLDQMQSY